ncbi:MAG: two-component sensor histidine kinase [Gammaproteobacteria bacterium HGW-Gammaproteobacteria-3]|nr:MAG: two-component sensor histidine kinase [Gammaproteobacteria bacterium HGW-Gammaproteobacteria-3]
MHKSIRVKLFLTFLLTILLVVAGMYIFMRGSLDRGFTEYIETRQRVRVENLIEELAQFYADTGSWEKLAGNKRQWIALLTESDNHHHRHSSPWLQKALTEPQDRWPPNWPAIRTNRPFTPLVLRVMLLRADKSIIFGRPEAVPQLTLHPITRQNQVIGFLGLLPGKAINQLGELRFMERQAKAFIWIALLMIALSAGLALLLAYLLGRPLKRITGAARELAVGRYNIRLPVESGDELGQLAQDFNEMAAALEYSEQARRRWVADISHELRTPLAVLRGELEALQDGIRPLTLKAVDSLFAAVMRLNRLTEDLYQLALSDQGALTYRKTVIDPLAILTKDLAALQPEFDNKRITAQLINPVADTVRIYADPDRLSQLFRNLLTNSVNYTDTGGRLNITVSQREGLLQIDMADSAPGVATQDLVRLFDRFYRVESSRNRHHGGAGLGLAICSNIVAAHQGYISAEPSSLGGLLIHIELPEQA